MEPAVDPMLILIIVLLLAFVIVMVATRGRRGRRLEQLATHRSESTVEAQVLAMTQAGKRS